MHCLAMDHVEIQPEGHGGLILGDVEIQPEGCGVPIQGPAGGMGRLGWCVLGFT